jgi:AraC family transcriptional regulator
MKPDTVESYQQRIARVLVHIQTHLEDAIPLGELAGVANFSPYHFHRVFRGMVGESVKEHVRRLRLERAAQKLRSTDKSVLAIALDSGYETHESFTRAFEGMFGASPSTFRKSRKAHVPQGSMPIQRKRVPLDVLVRKTDRFRVAFVRHVGPYDEVGRAWEKLMSWSGRQGLLGPRTRVLGIVHDDMEITPPDKMRYDAAISIADHVAASGEVGIQEIESGEYAVALHAGPYGQLGETYADLCGQWLPGSGRELRSAPALEFYLNSPATTPHDQLRTEIWLPLVT